MDKNHKTKTVPTDCYNINIQSVYVANQYTIGLRYFH